MKSSLGCVNPCGICFLYDKKNNLVGECLDTPNNFAAACKIDSRIHKGVTHYQYFGDNERFANDEDIQSRIKWLNLSYHKQHIKIY